jgi:transcriptional regulator with XRE-family HTH domain
MEMRTVGHNVRAYRESRGMTQQDLARVAMTCTGTVYRIERGLPANRNTVLRLARALRVKVKQLETGMQTGDQVETEQG